MIMLQNLHIRRQLLGVPVPVEGFVCGRHSSCNRLNYKRGSNLVVVVVEATVEISVEDSSTAAGKKRYSLPPVQGSKRVVLVRHGQSTWNEMGRIQGSSDISRLTPRGEKQAEISHQMLLSDSFDVCIHSPLSRAKRTAEIIWGAARNEVDMIPIDDLREIDLYAFQGLYKEQGKQLFGDVYSKWKKDPVNFLVDGHYPVRELWDRASGCWTSILGQTGNSILVVAHNAVNQALVATATGLGPMYFRHLLQSNCGVSVLDFTPSSAAQAPFVCLERMNQTPTSPLGDGKSGGRKSPARIVLVCHGATGTSVRQQFASSAAEPLSPLGSVQSMKIGEHLLNVPVHSVFHSPQPCASKTAEVISQKLERADLGITPLKELKDFDWGPWRGKSKHEVLLPSSTGKRWQDQLQLNSVAGGETFESFWTRAAQSWQMLVEHLGCVQAENGGEGTVVVVGHSAVHEAMLCHCLGLDQTYFGSFQFDNGSLSVVDFPGSALAGGVVRCLNYTAHLDRWAVPVTRRP